MSLSQSKLKNYFNELLEPNLFEDYTPNGLQIEGASEIKRLAFSVSATQDSIQKSIFWGADGLVVHHGVFWKHQGTRPITGAWGQRIKLCVKHDLNLFSYHLPLDGHQELGNAVALARELGLINILPFAPYKGRPLGCKGELSTPLSAFDFKMKLNKLLKHEIVLASGDQKREMKTIGIVTGGANNEWIKAHEDGLDAYLTGEISEYNWHDCIEAGLHYFAGGHHATERFGIKSLMEKVKKDFPDLEVTFFDSNNEA
jgi:dinuclear metal center YbgI/SA1388 family protein